MSIAILFDHKDPQPWKIALEKSLGLKVHIDPTDDSVKDQVEFLICWKPKPNSIETYKNVKLIQSVGAGIDHIFVENTIRAGTIVSRITDENLLADMYEFVLTGILAHLKNMNLYGRAQQDRNWSPKPYRRIRETKVSFLGLGYLGKGVALKLERLGFLVKGWSNSLKEIEGVETFAGEEGLSEMLASTDVLVNLLPLTEETFGILNRNLFSKLKKNCYLINVGRGPHLVESDLLFAFDQGMLSGALLDVFVQEPLPMDHVFWTDPRIAITPHVASISDTGSVVEQIVNNYKALKAELPISNTVDLEKGY